jgi:CheY-like chemotaxis protein
VEPMKILPMKILLVDDSKTARYALRLKLQGQGVQVDTAESAEAALDRVRTTPPDAILMDHTMPRMNGFEALEILKSNPGTAHIPVVMCTAHDDPVFSAQAVRRGALGVLTKTAAAEGLPSLLGQIRATLAQDRVPEAPPTLEAVQGPKGPVPSGQSREEIEALIEERLDLVLPMRLAELVDPQLARIHAQLRQVIAEQVEAAIDALPAPSPAPLPAPPPPPTAASGVEIAPRELADGLDASETRVLVEALATLRRGLCWSYALGSIALVLALGAVVLRFLSG